ncbi:MAG: hypothetical protein ACRDHW_00300 [Ktedonobacteraceae bacterium]
MYNPETYPWYQCYEEDYNPFDPPDEEESECERMDAEREALEAFMEVESYCERYANERWEREAIALRESAR